MYQMQQHINRYKRIKILSGSRLTGCYDQKVIAPRVTKLIKKTREKNEISPKLKRERLY